MAKNKKRKKKPRKELVISEDLEENKKIKFLIIGYDLIWHHSQHLIRYLKRANFDVEFRNGGYDHQEKVGVKELTIPEDIDYVISFQFTTRYYFIKENPKTIILQYNAEVYWNPGCLNPDFLVTAYPEMIERYYQHNPEIFDSVIDYACMSIFVDEEIYNYEKEKDLKGINFMGPLFTNGGKYRLYRDAYIERKKLVEENEHLIKYYGTHHDGDYPEFMSRFEASIVGHAYMAYFSKRVLENSAAGVINCLYIADPYQKKYYEDYGYHHMENCFFFKNSIELTVFYTLTEEQKEKLRVNAKKLYQENYTVEKVMKKIFDWINSHISFRQIEPDKLPFMVKKIKYLTYYHNDELLLSIRDSFEKVGWEIDMEIIGSAHPFNDEYRTLNEYNTKTKIIFAYKPRGFMKLPDDAIKIVYIDDPFIFPPVINPDVLIVPTEQIRDILLRTYPFLFAQLIDTHFTAKLSGDKLLKIIDDAIPEWVFRKSKFILPDKRGRHDLWDRPVPLEQQWRYSIRTDCGVQNFKDAMNLNN